LEFDADRGRALDFADFADFAERGIGAVQRSELLDAGADHQATWS
jgi:hypothetical protein